MADGTNGANGARSRLEALLTDIRDGTRLGPTEPRSRLEALLIDIRDGGGGGDLSALGLSLDGSTINLKKDGTGTPAVTIPDATAQAKGLMTTNQVATLGTAIQASEKAAANGVATLDATGHVPASQLSITAPTLTFLGGGRGELSGVMVAKTLGIYTLAELQAISADLTENGTASEHYAEFAGYLGQTYDFGVRTGDYAGTGQDAHVIAQLVGILHDDIDEDGSLVGKTHDEMEQLTVPKAGLTFLCNRSLAYAYQMNAYNTNGSGWKSSAMRTKLNSGEVYQSLPSDLKDAAVAVLKQTNNTGNTGDRTKITTTSDKFWLASACEMWGPNTTWTDNSAVILPYEGTQYAYFANNGVTWTNYALLANRNKTNTGGVIQSREGTFSSGYSRLRSPNADDGGRFLISNSPGQPNIGYASHGSGVCLGFCI